MELDDLKQTWKQTNKIPSKNENIMELIQHSSTGPVAALKHAFRKQIRLITLLAVLVTITSIHSLQELSNNILFWSYIIFCAGVAVFFYFNYRLVKKMEGMEGMLKSTLQQQIDILETRLKWHLVGIKLVALFFIVLLEVLPHFQHARMLDKWHALSPLIRFGSYAAFLVLQYFGNRSFARRKFGNHVAYLKELAQEME